MTTIEQIIKENWYTIYELKKYYKEWRVNWFWPKHYNLFKYLPRFNSKKFFQLKLDLNLIADIHDLSYNKWWNVLDFIKANYILWKNVIRLLHWTNFFWRLLVFLWLFLWTTLFGFKYFNWE